MIYIRELVAWVVVFGLVVILVNSKMKEKQTRSRNYPKKPLKLNDPVAMIPPTLEVSNAGKKELKRLEKDLDKEARAISRKMVGVPKRKSLGSRKRRGADSVPGPSHGVAEMQYIESTSSDGPTSHKRA